MTEHESKEVEGVLLHLSDARTRTKQAAQRLERDGASSSVVDALREAEGRLGELHRSLTQSTYYAVPDDSLRLTL